MLQQLRHRRGILALAIAAFSVVAHAGESATATLLKLLSGSMKAARALPAGERPAPPETDLGALVGASRSDVKKALGTPSSCEPDLAPRCGSQPMWAYAWGPADQPNREVNGAVIVRTGGPFLLKLRFQDDAVVEAVWEGGR